MTLRRTGFLMIVALIALLIDLTLLLESRPTGASELHAKLWPAGIRSLPGSGDGERLPHLDGAGAWRRHDGQVVKLADVTERAGPNNIDGPPYLVTVSLGRNQTYGNFLRTLSALDRSKACIVAVVDTENASANDAPNYAPVLEIMPGNAPQALARRCPPVRLL